MREETTTNFYAFWSLANSKDVDAGDLIRIVRKDKSALEAEGSKFNVEPHPFLTEESGKETDKPWKQQVNAVSEYGFPTEDEELELIGDWLYPRRTAVHLGELISHLVDLEFENLETDS